MKNTYAVKKINIKGIGGITDYWKRVNEATIHYCRGVDELRSFCGGALHRQRAGYSGINGDIEYVAYRVS